MAFCGVSFTAGVGQLGGAVGAVSVSSVSWIIDPGHAWLRVPLDSLAGVAVSSYSYVDHAEGVAYLEEDCDAGAWARFHGVDLRPVSYVVLDRPALCRCLPRIHDERGFVVWPVAS